MKILPNVHSTIVDNRSYHLTQLWSSVLSTQTKQKYISYLTRKRCDKTTPKRIDRKLHISTLHVLKFLDRSFACKRRSLWGRKRLACPLMCYPTLSYQENIQMYM